VQYTGSQTLDSVVAKYQGAGQSEWKKLPLARKGRGWGALVPCADVRRGVLRYYVQGFDASGSPTALSGDPKHPFTVPIRHAIATPPPAFPGEAPPTQCTSTGEEAPAEAKNETPPQCEDDSQCSSGVCEDGRCVESRAGASAERGFARVWIGVSGSADLVSLPGGDDVCTLTSDAAPTGSYYCTNPSGTDYPTRHSPAQNASITPGQGGHVDGGPSFGAVHVLASLDYAFSASFLAGVRVGYVAHGYPGAAAKNDGHGFSTPIHAELRATYVLGDQPLAHVGFAPFLFAGGGVAEFAAEKDVMIRQGNAPLPVAGALPKNAWLVNGPLFLAAGGGMRYAFSQRIAFSAGLKLAAVIGGGFIPVASPELALQYGF
jgi:hypothetical protein